MVYLIFYEVSIKLFTYSFIDFLNMSTVSFDLLNFIILMESLYPLSNRRIITEQKFWKILLKKEKKIAIKKVYYLKSINKHLKNYFKTTFGLIKKDTIKLNSLFTKHCSEIFSMSCLENIIVLCNYNSTSIQ